MRIVWSVWAVILFCNFSYGQDLNFKANLFQSAYSDEQWPGMSPRHQGYSFGVDVVIPDGNSLIIPGLYFQKTSLLPQKFDIAKPFAEYIDIKALKLPFQLGGHVIKSDLIDLNLHGGLAATYLQGVDENTQLIEEDFNDLRGAFVVGATLRVFFLTVQVSYDHGFSRIYAVKGPSGVQDKSKERMISFGVGVYF